MKYLNEYQKFLDDTKGENEDLYAELLALEGDLDEIKDRFWTDLEFGTGGIRGLMGAGRNRINLYTIGRASQGLSDFLNEKYKNPTVCIAYDSRHNSKEFALHTASVLAKNNIEVQIFDTLTPTPMLSFAVKHLKASAGVVITASHNPKEYNGYKVYGANGGQITDDDAKEILSYIKNTDLFSVKTMDLEKARAEGLFFEIPEAISEIYYEKVLELSVDKAMIKTFGKELKILYTPLHGTGKIPVQTVLKNAGFIGLKTVASQTEPDGDFPTCNVPNPEMEQVYDEARAEAQNHDFDLIMATDPDADRVGVLVRANDGFRMLLGNEIGALLCEYIISSKSKSGNLEKNSAVIKTIVTSDLGKEICKHYGVAMYEVLTGFKYIGELASLWSLSCEHSFLFGYEESYGYLLGDFVSDKDAVIASLLIAEMTIFYKLQGKTLIDALLEIHEKYGYFGESLISMEMKGKDGKADMEKLLVRLREEYAEIFAGFGGEIHALEDYLSGTKTTANETSLLTLPRSNVMKIIFECGSWIVFRPSGTEPKIKVYISAKDSSQKKVDEKLKALESITKKFII